MGRNSSGIRGSYESRALGDAVENDNSVVKRGTKTDNTLKEYQDAIATGKYDTRYCYFSPNEKGAYVLCDKLHNVNGDGMSSEFEAARIMANNGFVVVLGDESSEKAAVYVTNKNGKTSRRFQDGKLSADLISFEQNTITKLNNEPYKTIRRSLYHAKDKLADISVVYDKMNLLDEKTIREGIKDYYNGNESYEIKFLIHVKGSGRVVVYNTKKENNK